MSTDTLETPRLRLRKARSDDLCAIWQNVWKDDTIAETMLWKPTLTGEEAAARLERTMKYQSGNYAWFVCERDTDEPIGFAGMRENAPGEFEESGICVARKCQGQGYGREIVEALLREAFVTQGADRFIYACFRGNERSRRLCESFGFRYTESREEKREWDGKTFLVDYYRLTRDKYFT